MSRLSFKKLKKPPSDFFNYLIKSLMALGIWFLLFSLVYVNMQLKAFLGIDAFYYLMGNGLLLAILIIAGGMYLFFFDYLSFSKNKFLFLIGLSCLLAALLFEICITVPLNVYLFPMAGIGMLLVLLLNLRASFISILILGLAFGLMTQNRLNIFLIMFLGGTLGIALGRNARRRSQLLNAGVLVGGLNFLIVICLGFYEGIDLISSLKNAAWGFGSGILSSFLVTGILPIFEMLFGLTTNITLLELSDLNNPVLKGLILKAPGTYHHSLIVGNLAEAACDSISARALLARVGAYYHDIGKIEKASYFSENETEMTSRHEELTPSMSALIIVNHVKDGIELAKRHKLPMSIINFIEQHHGTGLIYFFYQRALEKVKDESLLKDEDFRYRGPKPQTKEVAVVLLADAVEASSRTLSDPTPTRIKALTQRIINNKFIDGQLDECDLSLKDLHKIAKSFTTILTGIFHSRVEYPMVSSSST